MSLLREHSARRSLSTPPDVSDRPADIMRGLQVDLLDVLRRCGRTSESACMQQQMLTVFAQQEMQLTPVLAEMQLAGIAFDGGAFRKSNKAVERRLMDFVRKQPQRQQQPVVPLLPWAACSHLPCDCCRCRATHARASQTRPSSSPARRAWRRSCSVRRREQATH